MPGWGHWAGMWTPGRRVSENALQQLRGLTAPSPSFILHNCWPCCLHSPWRIASHFPEHRWISEVHNSIGDCHHQLQSPSWQHMGRRERPTYEGSSGLREELQKSDSFGGMRQRKPSRAAVCGCCRHSSGIQVWPWHPLITRCTKPFLIGFRPSFPVPSLCPLLYNPYASYKRFLVIPQKSYAASCQWAFACAVCFS